MPENQLAYGDSESPPDPDSLPDSRVKSLRQEVRLQNSESNLAWSQVCASAPVFTVTSKCSGTEWRIKGRTPF